METGTKIWNNVSVLVAVLLIGMLAMSFYRLWQARTEINYLRAEGQALRVRLGLPADSPSFGDMAREKRDR